MLTRKQLDNKKDGRDVVQEVHKKTSRKAFSANLERQIFEIIPSKVVLN